MLCVHRTKKTVFIQTVYKLSGSNLPKSVWLQSLAERKGQRGGWFALQIKTLSHARSQGRATACCQTSTAQPGKSRRVPSVAIDLLRQSRHDCSGGRKGLPFFFLITDSVRDERVFLKIRLQSFRDFIRTREWIMGIWYFCAYISFRYFLQSLCSLPSLLIVFCDCPSLDIKSHFFRGERN